MSGTVHVCLVSEQGPANAIPLLMERPDLAWLVAAERMRERARFCAAAGGGAGHRDLRRRAPDGIQGLGGLLDGASCAPRAMIAAASAAPVTCQPLAPAASRRSRQRASRA